MGSQDHENENIQAQTQEAFETVFSFVPALVLKSALLLDIPDIIAREGPNASLSLHEIASRLPTQNPHLDSLSRILRYLSSRGIFLRSRVGDEDRYALSNSAKLFFVKENNPSSLVPLALLETHEVLMARWHHLHECVLQGCHPFLRAHGKDIYSCGKDDPQFNNVLNDYMGFFTMVGIDQIVNCYEGFKELQSIVDVGGGKGTALREIVKAYPHIHGINFDLPHVVATAPPNSGIEHVGGSMFDTIPSADAIFMKKTLFDWDDESCMKILGKCHEALPENGKLILVEEAATDEMNQSELVDMLRIAHVTSVRERSEQEWREIVQKSAFTILKIMWLPGTSHSKVMIIEATK